MQRVKLQARYQEENCLFVETFFFKLQSLTVTRAAADYLVKSLIYLHIMMENKNKVFGPVVNGYPATSRKCINEKYI